jgi:hypothetical protein
VLPDSQSAARLGDTIIIQGDNLTTENVAVRFMNRALPNVIELAPAIGDKPGEITVTLPNTSAAVNDWAPGLYTVSMIVRRPQLSPWPTNELSMALAPIVTRTPAITPAGSTVTLTSTPRLREGQRVLLVLGNSQVQPDKIDNPADLTKPTSIDFKIPAHPAGPYLARLRVDGIDSIPVIRTGIPNPPAFDPNQMVQL